MIEHVTYLRGRLRHRRTGGGAMTGLTPIRDRFFNQPSLRVMLCEELGLVFHQFREEGLERLGDLPVQLLSIAAQQAGMRCVLHQSMLKGIVRIWWRAALKYQLGGDKASERGFELALGKAADGTHEHEGKLAADRRANLRHNSY